MKSSTNISYARSWNRFTDFLEKFSLPFSLPSSPNHINLFIAHLHTSNLKYSTIRTYLSAISFVHKLHNVFDSCTSLIVSKALQGLRNSESVLPKTQLKPITRDVLHKLVDVIPFTSSCNYTKRLLKALFLTTFYACLRAGEVVRSNDPSHTLQLSQLTPMFERFSLIGYSILFLSYKHSNNLTPTLLLHPSTDKNYCPVDSMYKYLKMRGTSIGPIFIDSFRKPIQREQFSLFLKQCLALAGLSPNEYNTHSFRIGRATQMAMDQVPENDIRTAGRWKSNAYIKYVRPDSYSLPQ
jgi:site-specific recombinase XerD